MASSREEGELVESSSSSGEEDSDEESGKQGPSALKFKNDGSFLEMFKKMQDGQSTQAAAPVKKDSTQLKIPERDDSSPAEKTMKKEDPPAAQKKPGLMSIVSSPSETAISAVESVKLTFLFQGWARQSRRFHIQSYCSINTNGRVISISVQVGKRRGGKSLPVGVVKKQKKPEEEDETVSFHQTKFVVINT